MADANTGTETSYSELPKFHQHLFNDVPVSTHAFTMTDEDAVKMINRTGLPLHHLEKVTGDPARAVEIRRKYLIYALGDACESKSHLSRLPYKNYDWNHVSDSCCENVIGYVPVPVGIAGPLVIDGSPYYLPMATTEGALVASISRGCKALNRGTGVTTVLLSDGITRSPCVHFSTLQRAHAAKLWLDTDNGRKLLQEAFESTSSIAKIQSITSITAGSSLYIRFKATTGDAMGMNMISKGVERALSVMKTEGNFTDMEIITLSGNCCSDKKSTAINWIEGRGKSVVAEAFVHETVVREVLKCSIESLVRLNTMKNLVGSAMAGALGGFNAHAANIVAAMFISTGQDVAQVGESANCITLMESSGNSLHVSVTMPSIEVGTIGGGTSLEPQNAMLSVLGLAGPHSENPGQNGRRMASIIAGATLAGELSLCAALTAGHLVDAHMRHNRKSRE